mgnify:CR=1 FL=1
MNEYDGTDIESMSYAANYSDWIVDLFKNYLIGNVAEVGAGIGTLTKTISELETINEITAFEPSIKMHDFLIKNINSNNNIKSINDTLENQRENYQEYFDSILYINVMEHIDNDKAEINFIYNVLKPDGYVCIFVPALSFLFSNFDRSIGHKRRYHRQQLKKLFASNGFQIITTKYIDFIGFFIWYFYFKFLKRRLGKIETSTYDKLAIPIIRKLETLVQAPIRKKPFINCQEKTPLVLMSYKKTFIKPTLEYNANVVYGSRFLSGATHRVLFFWYFIDNKFLTLLCNKFSNFNLTDMETIINFLKLKSLKMYL